MVRNISVPAYDYTLRLHRRNLPRRTDWAGPGQQRARKIQDMVAHLRHQYQSAEITWVKGHAGAPGNERADALAGMAAGRTAWSPFTSLAHLKLWISEKFQRSKKEWDVDPHRPGTEEIPPPPPKKSCIDQARNAIARTAAQNRTGHWRSAVYFKRVRKRKDDKCWFCKGGAKVTRSHAGSLRIAEHFLNTQDKL
jgi:hypothetical protein